VSLPCFAAGHALGRCWLGLPLAEQVAFDDVGNRGSLHLSSPIGFSGGTEERNKAFGPIREGSGRRLGLLAALRSKYCESD
jgi:hypothetical protein